MLYFNVRSLLPKIDDLRTICALYSPDIVCIVETWLDNTVFNSEIAIQGYSIHRLDRSRHGGGLLIFVKSVYVCSMLFKGSVDFECMVMSVSCGKNNYCTSPDLTTALFYRPPNAGHAPLDSLFSTFCNLFTVCSCNLYLVGDFNIDFISKLSPLYHKLLSIVSSFNLTQVVTEPTRVTSSTMTLIDLIFVSSINSVKSCVTVSPLANADHFGLQLILSISSLRRLQKSVPRKLWRYSLADWQKAAELLECVEWDLILPSDADEYWRNWKSYFMQIMEICIPHTNAKVKRNPPWLNRSILNAIKKRDTLFRSAKASGNLSDRLKYNRKRNQVVSMLRESKKNYFDNQLNQADAKVFWKTVRVLNRDNSASIPTLSDGTMTADTNLEKASVLNRYFYTCFNHTAPPLQTSPEMPLPPSNCPVEILCTEE